MIGNPYESPESLGNAVVRKKRLFSTFTKLLVLLCIVLVVGAIILPAVNRGRSMRPALERMECKNNLEQIAMALHNYYDDFHALPPAYTVDSDGKALHSWRTLILPYLEQKILYETIDLTKPWNDSVNAEAFKTAPSVYRCPSGDFPQNYTGYLGVVAENGCFHPTQPRQFSEITDGTSNTLMVIEVASGDAVHWMAPQDADESIVLKFGKEGTLVHTGGTQAALADGSVRFLSATLEPAVRRALISIAGNDKLGEF